MKSDCILWSGPTNGWPGYGKCGKEYAHRRAWEIANGPIPPGKWILHKCDVRLCVNPAHLFLGDASENALDAFRKGRRVSPFKTMQPMRGARNPKARLLWGDIEVLRDIYESGAATQVQLAEMFGLKQPTVSKILRYETWKPEWKHGE